MWPPEAATLECRARSGRGAGRAPVAGPPHIGCDLSEECAVLLVPDRGVHAVGRGRGIGCEGNPGRPVLARPFDGRGTHHRVERECGAVALHEVTAAARPSHLKRDDCRVAGPTGERIADVVEVPRLEVGESEPHDAAAGVDVDAVTW